MTRCDGGRINTVGTVKNSQCLTGIPFGRRKITSFTENTAEVDQIFTDWYRAIAKHFTIQGYSTLSNALRIFKIGEMMIQSTKTGQCLSFCDTICTVGLRTRLKRAFEKEKRVGIIASHVKIPASGLEHHTNVTAMFGQQPVERLRGNQHMREQSTAGRPSRHICRILWKRCGKQLHCI